MQSLRCVVLRDSAAAAGVSLYLAVAPPAAQQKPPTKEELAKDNKLFLTLARQTLKWDVATEPSKIAGPLHYVGTAGLSLYLFVTSEGNILFNTGMPESGPMIVESMQKLGFAAKDIKILINGHGHSDHAGAFAHFKKLTGAQLAIMEADVPMVEDGGKSDFQARLILHAARIRTALRREDRLAEGRRSWRKRRDRFDSKSGRRSGGRECRARRCSDYRGRRSGRGRDVDGGRRIRLRELASRYRGRRPGTRASRARTLTKPSRCRSWPTSM